MKTPRERRRQAIESYKRELDKAERGMRDAFNNKDWLSFDDHEKRHIDIANRLEKLLDTEV